MRVKILPTICTVSYRPHRALLGAVALHRRGTWWTGSGHRSSRSPRAGRSDRLRCSGYPGNRCPIPDVPRHSSRRAGGLAKVWRSGVVTLVAVLMAIGTVHLLWQSVHPRAVGRGSVRRGSSRWRAESYSWLGSAGHRSGNRVYPVSQSKALKSTTDVTLDLCRVG